MWRSRSVHLVVVFATYLTSQFLFGQSNGAQLCIAPNSGSTPQRCAPGLCDSGQLSLKIDSRPKIRWPEKDSLALTDLDTSTSHRVVVYRAGKAQQAFRFRFSDFKSKRLCLFLNDLYWTAQLWESKDTSWCKCP